MMPKVPLSIAVITKNEEERLPDCLRSVSFADETVVVDSISTDKTVEIAKEFGCRVFVEDWKGYGPQRNSAIGKCKHDWVLVIDADERVPLETKKAIFNILKNPTANAYNFPRKNFFRNRWIKHCGWWPDRDTRLINKQYCKYEGSIHPKLIVEGKINFLEHPIEHFSYKNYAHLIDKMQLYSSLSAKELLEKGRKATFITPVFHGLWMFMHSYFLRSGFIYGIDGLVIAATMAGGSFFKYAKLLELQKYE
ncbi:glycosyltransferase family 2 protein [Thermodesulfovibrionales bacterium]|nr:glycosyltransferase family 2 protein [Thermodesulfovibrionales bacterium]